MIPRPASIRQVAPIILFCLFISVFIILISLESSQYFKFSLCHFLNFSSKPKTFYKILNNTEDEKTSVDCNSIWCLDMANRLDSEQYLPESPFLLAAPINSTRLHRLPYRYSQWKSSPSLARLFTPCEHNLAMRLLMIIERICRKDNITFMLIYGSLLGSYRHHDVIPWDDDIDIMIPIEEHTHFIDIIKQMNKTLVQHDALSNGKGEPRYYKIFFKNTSPAGRYSWNFPFIDIFFYATNETHLWETDYPSTITKKENVFPLVMRPFGELWLPTPRKPQEIFKFDPFDDCKGHTWNHRNEIRQKEISVKCNDLKHIYPFVERQNQSDAIEILRTHDTIIHTVFYN
ncbi:unnamed protein product [Rotaria sp. Silwood2]|nr:unnamed protein product [Rotaria sp. Silwood2]CAF4267831.1 unnamed protein product [Rotaria sp. Silwood2]